jgi:hypothetical protein
MSKRIKNKSELPEWFGLEKYDQAKILDAAGWYVQLYIRARCLAYLADGQNISEILNLIRAAPIIDVTRYSFLSVHYHSGMFYEEPIIKQSKHGVHSLTVHELYTAAINMEESKRIQAKAFFDVILNSLLGVPPDSPRDPSILSREKTAFLYEPVHHVLRKPLDQALLGVNLLLPDRELVEQFKANLPLLRGECGATLFSEKWHQPDFAEWARLGVLPYLDLMIWAQEEDKNVTYKVLEEAIFSSSEGSEDRVRKTTAPKAKELTSKRSLAFLRAQAIREQGEQRPG